MTALSGVVVFGGVNFAPISWHSKARPTYAKDSLLAFEAEWRRIQEAKSALEADFSAYDQDSSAHFQPKAIFAAHREMAKDILLLEKIREHVFAGRTAEYAIEQAGKHFFQVLAAAADDYLAERRFDVLDVCNRLIEKLAPSLPPEVIKPKAFFAAGERFLPSEVIRLKEQGACGFLALSDAKFAHSAILARSLGLTYVIQIHGLRTLAEGTNVLVDFSTGEIFAEPDPKTFSQHSKKTASIDERTDPSTTVAGKLRLKVNMNSLAELDLIAGLAHDGIGLIRSELLFLEDQGLFRPKHQEETYRLILRKLSPRQVVVRTFDHRGDKSLPAESKKAIIDPDVILKSQLTSLYKAAPAGNLAILFPFVSDLKQAEKLLATAKAVRDDLKASGFDNLEKVPLGAMIETPEAVMLADEFARKFAFLAIGTNDLIQHSLGIAREEINLKTMQKYQLETIRRQIQLVAAGAKNANIPVGVCGIMAETEATLACFADFGIAYISVSEARLHPLRRHLGKLNKSD